MGLWWKIVDKKPPIKSNTVWFYGDPSAISKDWPVLWRFGQDRYSLAVGDFPRCGEFTDGYYVFFHSGFVTMQFRRLLTSRYLMVRVGPDPVEFWVENKNGHVGELSRTGVVVPRIGLRRNSTGSLLQQTTLGLHTWV